MIHDLGYMDNIQYLKFHDGVVEKLMEFYRKGYKLIVLTNQEKVALGYFKEQRVHDINEQINRKLERHGVQIDAFYHCTHHPSHVCSCMKPRTGMLEQAAAEHDISLADSVIVGGTDDLRMGLSASVEAYAVKTHLTVFDRRLAELDGVHFVGSMHDVKIR